MRTERRRFIATAGGMAAAAAATAIVDCQGMAAWFHQGDGLKLWEEAYAPVNLVPRPGNQSGPEMRGWFRKKIATIAEGKVDVLPLPAPVLRDLKKLSAEVVREESEKTSMARKVHVSFTKFQALVGPWDHVAEGAYHQLVAG